MQVNSDFSRPVTIKAEEYQWLPSSQAGVDRMMLDRIGDEKARATSVVTYASNSHFPEHLHPGGEEILVLSGTFSDQSGDYTEGWYLRNPPGSKHAPFSNEGTRIFVKLWQMRPTEKLFTRVNTLDPASWTQQDGSVICPLYRDDYETVFLQKLNAGENVFELADSAVPAEILVISGQIHFKGADYGQGSWLRLPDTAQTEISAGQHGTTVYLKSGDFFNIDIASFHE